MVNDAKTCFQMKFLLNAAIAHFEQNQFKIAIEMLTEILKVV